MNKLWVRLSLAFTVVVLIAVLIIISTSFFLQQMGKDEDRTNRFLSQPNGLADNLGDYYHTHKSWAGVEPMLVGAKSVFFRDDIALVLADGDKKIIYHPQSAEIGKPLKSPPFFMTTPIKVDGQIVGFLGTAPYHQAGHEDDRRGPPPFFRELIQTLLVIAIVGGVAGIGFGVVMSRSLSAPLSDLAGAARAIGKRDWSRRVEEKGSDEIQDVARAFNEMVVDLEEGEQLRRNMLADVAHELRTPLSVLQGNLRAILDEVYPMNEEEMGRLYEHTRLLSRLVSDLHELAQAEAHQLPLDMQATDLSQLAAQTAETFRPSAEAKGISLITDLPEDLPPVQVDPARLTQVLQNLLANALRHTPTNGTITVKTNITFNTVSLSIADTGDGIPPEHLEHIFDRFYRTDPARTRDKGGAGLGLAIARAIVKAHGGQISVASQGVDMGSMFTITLPQLSGNS